MTEVITEAHSSMTVIFSHITNGLHKNLDRNNHELERSGNREINFSILKYTYNLSRNFGKND